MRKNKIRKLLNSACKVASPSCFSEGGDIVCGFACKNEDEHRFRCCVLCDIDECRDFSCMLTNRFVAEITRQKILKIWTQQN